MKWGRSKVERRLTLQSGCRFLRAWLGLGTDLSGSEALKRHLSEDGVTSEAGERAQSRLAALPGNTKMKQAASPPIMEMTRPMSGVKSARTSVTTNHTNVCRMRLLFSRRTHTSTCSPWKRSHSPSITALDNSRIRFPDWNDQRWQHVCNLHSLAGSGLSYLPQKCKIG